MWSLAVWLAYTGPLVSIPTAYLAWLPPWISRCALVHSHITVGPTMPAAAMPVSHLLGGFDQPLLFCICSNVEINGAFLGAAAYVLYYLCLEPVAGLTWSACVGVPIWLTATAFRHTVSKRKHTHCAFLLSCHLTYHTSHLDSGWSTPASVLLLHCRPGWHAGLAWQSTHHVVCSSFIQLQRCLC